MDMMAEIWRLRGEHDDLVALAVQLGYYVEAPQPPSDTADMTAFHAVRTRMRNVLIAHLKREDWVLYPALIASSDHRLVDTARDFIYEMGTIAALFTDYSRKWMPDAIAADWTGYCAETRAILTALATRIERENGQLYPLAEALDAGAAPKTATG